MLCGIAEWPPAGSRGEQQSSYQILQGLYSFQCPGDFFVALLSPLSAARQIVSLCLRLRSNTYITKIPNNLRDFVIAERGANPRRESRKLALAKVH